jgi:biotin operon repressor
MDTPQAAQATEVPPAGVAAPGAGILCEWDKCQPLTKRQKRFASGACRAAYHDSLHPRINQPGVEPLCGEGSIKARIAALLSGDGLNRTGDQIAYELRISGATALRELRKLRHDGARIHMQRLHGPRRPACYWMVRAGKGLTRA